MERAQGGDSGDTEFKDELSLSLGYSVVHGGFLSGEKLRRYCPIVAG